MGGVTNAVKKHESADRLEVQWQLTRSSTILFSTIRRTILVIDIILLMKVWVGYRSKVPSIYIYSRIIANGLESGPRCFQFLPTWICQVWILSDGEIIKLCLLIVRWGNCERKMQNRIEGMCTSVKAWGALIIHLSSFHYPIC